MRDYGLTIVLAVLFVVAWLGQLLTQWREFVQEEAAHGAVATYADFSWVFWSRTLENWQSEWLQLLSFVLLTTFLVSKGSHESKDSQDRLEAKVDRIAAGMKVDVSGL